MIFRLKWILSFQFVCVYVTHIIIFPVYQLRIQIEIITFCPESENENAKANQIA